MVDWALKPAFQFLASVESIQCISFRGLCSVNPIPTVGCCRENVNTDRGVFAVDRLILQVFAVDRLILEVFAVDRLILEVFAVTV